MCTPEMVHGPAWTVLASTRGGSSCRRVCTPWKSPAAVRPVRTTSPAATSSRYPSAPSPREPPTSSRTSWPADRSSATMGSGYPVEGRRIPASAFAADSAAAEPDGTRMRDAGFSVNAAPGLASTETGFGTTPGVVVTAALSAAPLTSPPRRSAATAA